MSKYDVCVQLTGQDGNVFSIIGRVSKALKKAGENEAANEFINAAMDCEDYNAVLRLCMETVEVK